METLLFGAKGPKIAQVFDLNLCKSFSDRGICRSRVARGRPTTWRAHGGNRGLPDRLNPKKLLLARLSR
jgi:hypothetical protein